VAYDKRYGEFVRELLEDLGEIRLRPMFGGAGVYVDDLFFGLIFEETLFLRADDVNRPAFEDAGSRQFTYPMKDGEIASMAYWSLPDTAADDPEEAVAWARGAVDAVMRKKAAGPRRRKV
jgi:DNA transformation protein and related proteins